MDCNGCSQVEVVSVPGNNKIYTIVYMNGVNNDGMTNLNTCLQLKNDDAGIAGNPSFSIRLDDNTIVYEILSRLPVKSLMRFKCVSKYWLYLIEEDSYFIDLHLTRSQARPSLAYVIPLVVKDRRYPEIRYKGHDEVFLTADLSLEGTGRADIHTMRKTNMFCCDIILRPINGLMCFVDTHKYAVCIYNISTREASPWIQSTLLLDEKKEHKVLCLWYISVGSSPEEASDDGEEASDDGDDIEVCEILTLGSGTWRRIHEVPPYFLTDNLPCVPVNGSIYWCTEMFTSPHIWRGRPACIVAFDVGIEKFRVIQIPDFIRDQPLDPDIFFNHFVRLVELDGRVGIIRRISAFIAKLWIFDDHCPGNEKISKTTSGEIWIEETITLPFPWTRTLSLNVYAVVGTYQIILQTYQGAYRHMNNVSLHSYHWRKKTFKEINTSGAPASFPDACPIKMFTTFVESLVPVQRKRKNNTSLNNEE
ncbi:hypothetical protein MKW92_000398 [Papaver armeniacum]|nr:hypothetical protein MKW92_000398 [Papaver armeniacum]